MFSCHGFDPRADGGVDPDSPGLGSWGCQPGRVEGFGAWAGGQEPWRQVWHLCVHLGPPALGSLLRPVASRIPLVDQGRRSAHLTPACHCRLPGLTPPGPVQTCQRRPWGQLAVRALVTIRGPGLSSGFAAQLWSSEGFTYSPCVPLSDECQSSAHRLPALPWVPGPPGVQLRQPWCPAPAGPLPFHL